jgi:uncharacterized protein (DUF1501 family)
MTQFQSIPSRRAMLRLGWRTAAAAGIAGSVQSSWGQAGSGYRALVCVYLVGGNDSNNMIVPLEDAEYGAYASARGELALSRGSLLPVRTPGGAVYGLHPSLSELRELYNSGRLAVVANVGGAPAGRRAHYHTSEDVAYFEQGFLIPAWATRWADTLGTSQAFYTFASGAGFIAPGSAPTSGSHFENAGMRREMDAVNVGARFPESAFGRAMRDVAALVRIAPAWGMSRQVFTVTLTGFDTHRDQLNRQGKLFRDLSRSLGAFDRAMESADAADRVTVFTDTEFNRALRPNDAGGAEHGWGGHQLVLGRALRGGDVYGEFPSFQSAPDVWTPTMSRDQLAAELSRWAGASLSDLHHLFPRARADRKVGLFA